MSEAHAFQPAHSVRLTDAIARSMRPHQWVKNVLLFAALVFSQSLFDAHAVMLSVQAFLLFCLAASAVYLLNDVNDLEEDRVHPKKRNRPLAAGLVSPQAVMSVMAILVVVSLVGGYFISRWFCALLMIYLGMNVLYSVKLKHIVILDVMIIAIGFVLRAVAGAVAIGVDTSPWMVLCTMTLALLVGFGKRRNELSVLKEEASSHRACLEGYTIQFLDMMMSISGGAAIVTYTLYTMANLTVQRFGSHALVLTTPFVIYGVFRYLYLIHVKSEGGDPSKLFVTDRPILLNGCLWIVACAMCVYTPVAWLPWWIAKWSV
ncbi:MAG: decaprenyl-phosphate phosphoribosyltransferase [Rhodopirellula sp.]|nr:decaprenyl-phosphate phosphoribosyltransferase [Rhodopirellula sp.]